jgi:hypothetical protein
MNTISDEDIHAYLDGELPPEGIARIHAAIATDVLVAARVERGRKLRATVRGAFDPRPDRPTALPREVLPARAPGADAAAGDPPPRARLSLRDGRWRRPAIALLASLAALAIATRLRMPSGDVAVKDGVIVAHGHLARQLDSALADAPDPASRIAIGVTFRAAGGRLCRSFVAEPSRIAGVACRDGAGWSLPVLSTIDSNASGMPLNGRIATPAEVQVAIDQRIDGEAFDALQERQARDAGWR